MRGVPLPGERAQTRARDRLPERPGPRHIARACSNAKGVDPGSTRSFPSLLLLWGALRGVVLRFCGDRLRRRLALRLHERSGIARASPLQHALERVVALVACV